MDEDIVRQHAEGHGGAMVDGDLRRAASDLTDEGKASAGTVMAALPKKIDSAEITNSQADGDDWVVTIRYSGEGKAIDVGSRWAEREGRPMITELTLS